MCSIKRNQELIKLAKHLKKRNSHEWDMDLPKSIIIIGWRVEQTTERKEKKNSVYPLFDSYKTLMDFSPSPFPNLTLHNPLTPEKTLPLTGHLAICAAPPAGPAYLCQIGRLEGSIVAAFNTAGSLSLLNYNYFIYVFI